jgi:hypothetical protein
MYLQVDASESTLHSYLLEVRRILYERVVVEIVILENNMPSIDDNVTRSLLAHGVHEHGVRYADVGEVRRNHQGMGRL